MTELKKTTVKEFVESARMKSDFKEQLEGLRKEVSMCNIDKGEMRRLFREVPLAKIKEYRKMGHDIGMPLKMNEIVVLYVQEKRVPLAEIKDDSPKTVVSGLDSMKPEEKPDFLSVIIDTSYINSMVRESADIKMVFTRLHQLYQGQTGGQFEIVMPQGVYDELSNQLKGPRGKPQVDDKGRPKITSKAFNDLQELIYSSDPIIKLEKDYVSNEDAKEALSKAMQKKTKNRNARVGDGDTAVMLYIRDMAKLKGVAFRVMTYDTDFIGLLKGWKNVTVPMI